MNEVADTQTKLEITISRSQHDYLLASIFESKRDRAAGKCVELSFQPASTEEEKAFWSEQQRHWFRYAEDWEYLKRHTLNRTAPQMSERLAKLMEELDKTVSVWTYKYVQKTEPEDSQ